MSEAKIEVKVGGLTFAGEGQEAWLEKQLDKLLARMAELVSIGEKESASSDDPNKAKKAATKGTTLASFLTSKNAQTSQNARFLATAVWLHDRGAEKLTAGAVAKALETNHQKRLGNPADCLNQNVAKGFCEKVGKEFYVTPEGRASLP